MSIHKIGDNKNALNQIEIEIAHTEDFEGILNLQRLAYQENARRYNDFEIPPLTQTLEDIQEESKCTVILKAVEKDKIVGSIRAYEKDSSCYIGRLSVHPEYQNIGIGKKLVAEIENHFASLRFELFTGHLDKKNLAFYEKSGYKRFKTQMVTDGLSFVFFEKKKENNGMIN